MNTFQKFYSFKFSKAELMFSFNIGFIVEHSQYRYTDLTWSLWNINQDYYLKNLENLEFSGILPYLRY